MQINLPWKAIKNTIHIVFLLVVFYVAFIYFYPNIWNEIDRKLGIEFNQRMNNNMDEFIMYLWKAKKNTDEVLDRPMKKYEQRFDAYQEEVNKIRSE